MKVIYSYRQIMFNCWLYQTTRTGNGTVLIHEVDSLFFAYPENIVCVWNIKFKTI